MVLVLYHLVDLILVMKKFLKYDREDTEIGADYKTSQACRFAMLKEFLIAIHVYLLVKCGRSPINV